MINDPNFDFEFNFQNQTYLLTNNFEDHKDVISRLNCKFTTGFVL